MSDDVPAWRDSSRLRKGETLSERVNSTEMLKYPFNSLPKGARVPSRYTGRSAFGAYGDNLDGLSQYILNLGSSGM